MSRHQVAPPGQQPPGGGQRTPRAFGTAYRAALNLYPPSFRREYGAEMEEVFAVGAGEARRRGCWNLIRFLLREAAGLLAGVWRERTARDGLAEMLRDHGPSFLAGLVVAGAFFLGILFSGGPYIFHPALYGFVLIGLVLASVEAGRLQAERRPAGPRLLRTALALGLVLAVVPAARLADHVWLDSTASPGESLAFSLPGIDVRAVAVSPASSPGPIPWDELLPRNRSGLIHSGVHGGEPGARMVTVWHRRPSSPPYEILIPLMAATLATAACTLRRRHLAAAPLS